MARVREKVVEGDESVEFPPFRFEDWTRPGDAEGFAEKEEGDVVKQGTLEERRWTFLAAKARARYSAVKAGDHPTVTRSLPVGFGPISAYEEGRRHD